MGFLAPWFLAGAAAIGLPLWIHLLRQYRSTPHPFSSLMFFERRTQSSIKHRRLRYLLLLSLRIALLLLLALAFANPFVSRTSASVGGRKMLILAVDNSFSMRYDGHLARAKQAALSAVSNLGAGDRGQVLAIGSRVHFMTQPVEDPDALKNAIQSIQPSDERSSYGEFARALRTIAQSSRMPLEVHFASDLQKSSLPPAFSDLRLAPDTNLVYHSVADSKQPNWLVESVTAPAKIYDPKKVRVQAVIASVGADAAKRTVSLVLDGKVLESKPADVPANGRVTAEFLSLESPHGFHKAEIRIEPHDGLAEDDRFPFAIERADPHPVLFLHAAGEQRDELYYRAALESVPEAGFILEPLAVEQAANQAFSKYAFVVLSDIGTLPAGLENSLRNYVASGGSLLVALGPASAALQHVPVSNQAIQGSSYASRDGDRFQIVANADAEHPSLRRANKLDGVQFYQVIRVDPGQSRVIARLTNQVPLLLEKQVGEGRVLVFTSTFDKISNDLPLHAAFVPFVEETARYLGGQQELSTNVAVDSYVELRSAKEHSASVELIDPDGQHPLSLKEATTATSFQVSREGYYEIHRTNGRQEFVAVHADRRESDLTPVPKETLDLWRNTGRGIETSAPGEASDNQARPWSLWRYALLLVLIIAIIESVIASRYLSVEKEAA
ncbi:MAG TPA: BatA domain-containing protein [Bryobacteraceae bacterium]|nr:BatA domain-containing protein [Bryobacteraceae bacterium]